MSNRGNDMSVLQYLIEMRWNFANLINRHKKVKELKESKIQLEMTANFISF